MHESLARTLTLLPLLLCCAREHEACSQWVPEPMTVDGHVDEWTELALNNFEVPGLSWGILNDSDSLYLLLATWDPALIRTIRMLGVTLWFEDVESKKRDCGVRFSGGGGPFAPTEATPPPAFTPSGGIFVPHGEARTLDITIVKDNRPVPIETSALQGVAAMGSCSGSTCSYELRVPLRQGSTQPCSLASAPGRKLRVVAEIQVPVMPSGPPGGGPPDGGMGRPPGGGAGGPPGGGMGRPPGGGAGGPPGGGTGRPAPGSGPPRPPELETKAVILSLTLAVDPTVLTTPKAIAAP